MTKTVVAVVTGANKGIGFAVVEQLARAIVDGVVYLTARDEHRGLQALERLKKEGLSNIKYCQLDICDVKSCEKFVNHIKTNESGSNGGKIDILVNNAAIAFKHNATEDFGTQADVTMKTNYWALLKFCELTFPLLNENARVVNVSSSLGHLSGLLENKTSEAEILRQKLLDPQITLVSLNKLAEEFVALAKTKKHVEHGWINSAYSTSKMFVSVLTRIQQREIDAKRSSANILINAVHPGYVDTDMTSHKGPFPPARGAQPIVWAATIPKTTNHPKGGFIWHDNSVVDLAAAALSAPY